MPHNNPLLIYPTYIMAVLFVATHVLYRMHEATRFTTAVLAGLFIMMYLISHYIL